MVSNLSPLPFCLMTAVQRLCIDFIKRTHRSMVIEHRVASITLYNSLIFFVSLILFLYLHQFTASRWDLSPDFVPAVLIN